VGVPVDSGVGIAGDEEMLASSPGEEAIEMTRKKRTGDRYLNNQSGRHRWAGRGVILQFLCVKHFSMAIQ